MCDMMLNQNIKTITEAELTEGNILKTNLISLIKLTTVVLFLEQIFKILNIT